MVAVDPAIACRFLRALAQLSADVFRDDMTKRLELAAHEADYGVVDAVEMGTILDAWRVGLFHRALRAIDRPQAHLGHLRALWHVLGYAPGLQAQLTPLVEAWRDAASSTVRDASRRDLISWMRAHEGAIADAMRGPFPSPRTD
jgi:hypothetical protein